MKAFQQQLLWTKHSALKTQMDHFILIMHILTTIRFRLKCLFAACSTVTSQCVLSMTLKACIRNESIEMKAFGNNVCTKHGSFLTNEFYLNLLASGSLGHMIPRRSMHILHYLIMKMWSHQHVLVLLYQHTASVVNQLKGK